MYVNEGKNHHSFLIRVDGEKNSGFTFFFLLILINILAFFFILLIIIFLLVVHKDKVLIFVLNEHDPTPAHARISLKYIVGIILFFIKTLFLLASPLLNFFFVF